MEANPHFTYVCMIFFYIYTLEIYSYQLYIYFDHNNLVDDQQYGFLSEHSTEMVAISDNISKLIKHTHI